MLHPNTLQEIRESQLPCIEYEIGMFLRLLDRQNEYEEADQAASTRNDYAKIKEIEQNTSEEAIKNILTYAGMTLEDVSFETQNDEVGPADIVIYARNRHRETKKIGVSVKYDNDCIYNYTGRELLTEEQIEFLEGLLPGYVQNYLVEMIERFGNFDNWFQTRFNSRTRITSEVTNQYISLVRDAVVSRWQEMTHDEKDEFLYKVYRTDSPLDYWIYSFQKRGRFILCTNPPYIRRSSYDRVTVQPIASQYIGFFLDNQLLGKTQIKFNNGILERYETKTLVNAIGQNDVRKVQEILDAFQRKGMGIVVEGKPLKYGNPFTSWNFEISY